ncbi:MAG: folylpolyglutamate synthase/dihydrofolate synthase family protein [Pseudomonadota bacterium]
MTTFSSDLILERLRALHPRSIDLSLGRIERLLANLGHPERQLAPVVHIAGTNGKGSTLAMLDAMLQTAERRVQRYISPHLVHFNERFLFNSLPIDDAVLADALERCEQANEGLPISEFEITTAAGFLAFAERPADAMLLETGLGGRFDATNIVAKPKLTALSPISFDHQDFLGDQLHQIAFEKAGILKPGVPCVIGPQPAEVLQVVEARAAEVNAPIVVHGRDWRAWRAGEALHVEHRAEALELPLPALAGAHQIENAGLAVACALELGELRPGREAIAGGLCRAQWPARLQRLTRGPLVDLLPSGSELWLDGGHNPAAGKALADSLEDRDSRPWHLIVGMLNTKDERGFLAPFASRVDTIRAVPVPDEPASWDPAASSELLSADGVEAVPATSVEAALGELNATTSRPLRVLICGSLYLAGYVLRNNG